MIDATENSTSSIIINHKCEGTCMSLELIDDLIPCCQWLFLLLNSSLFHQTIDSFGADWGRQFVAWLDQHCDFLKVEYGVKYQQNISIIFKLEQHVHILLELILDPQQTHTLIHSANHSFGIVIYWSPHMADILELPLDQVPLIQTQMEVRVK